MKKLKLKTKLIIIVCLMIWTTVYVTFWSYLGMEKLQETSIVSLEEKVREDYDVKLKEQVDAAVSVLETFYQKAETG